MAQQRRIEQILPTVRAEDWRTLIAHVIRKLIDPLFNVHDIFEQNLVQDWSRYSPRPSIDKISFHVFRSQEIAQIADCLSRAGVAEDTVQTRMRRGDVVLVAFDGREVAGYTWATFSDCFMDEIGATLHLGPDEAVGFDTRVLPQWRGRGLQQRMSVQKQRYLYQKGYKRSLSWVNVLNVRSMKSQRHFGRRKIAIVFSSPILGIVKSLNISPSAIGRIQTTSRSLEFKQPVVH